MFIRRFRKRVQIEQRQQPSGRGGGEPGAAAAASTAREDDMASWIKDKKRRDWHCSSAAILRLYRRKQSHLASITAKAEEKSHCLLQLSQLEYVNNRDKCVSGEQMKDDTLESSPTTVRNAAKTPRYRQPFNRTSRSSPIRLQQLVLSLLHCCCPLPCSCNWCPLLLPLTPSILAAGAVIFVRRSHKTDAKSTEIECRADRLQLEAASNILEDDN